MPSLKHLLEMQGGRIWRTRRTQEGSTFSSLLPLVQEAPLEAAPGDAHRPCA